MPEMKIVSTPDQFAGGYANVIQVLGSTYEYTLTFICADFHDDDAEEIAAVIITRIRMTDKLARELVTALTENIARRDHSREMKELPETVERDDLR